MEERRLDKLSSVSTSIELPNFPLEGRTVLQIDTDPQAHELAKKLRDGEIDRNTWVSLRGETCQVTQQGVHHIATNLRHNPILGIEISTENCSLDEFEFFKLPDVSCLVVWENPNTEEEWGLYYLLDELYLAFLGVSVRSVYPSCLEKFSRYLRYAHTPRIHIAISDADDCPFSLCFVDEELIELNVSFYAKMWEKDNASVVDFVLENSNEFCSSYPLTRTMMTKEMENLLSRNRTWELFRDDEPGLCCIKPKCAMQKVEFFVRDVLEWVNLPAELFQMIIEFAHDAWKRHLCWACAMGVK